VPAPSLTTDAFVLLKRPPADAFQSYVIFSAEHGTLNVLQRIAKKSAATVVALDLFDEASLLLESSNQGRTWFVKETRLIARPAGIGRSYEALQFASEFTALLARNPVHEDSRAPVAALLRTALMAFATGVRPDVVYFKSLYCFARDEGYPVKQQWLPTLSKELRAEAKRLLGTPLANLEPASPENLKSKLLRRRLSDYLRGHTEILLD
jgi:hypothetical protein